MPKHLFSIFCILFSVTTFSQSKGGEAVYGVKVIEQPDSQLRKMYSEMFSTDIEELANEQTFTLRFNMESSVFYSNDSKGLSADAVKTSNLILGYTSKTWIKNDTVYIHSPQTFITEECIVVSKKKNKWEITSEQKTIDGYACYKATSFDIVVTPQGKEFKHPLVAWFCPEIPYSYAPLGYGGLPGLVMELQTKDAVFGLKNLVLENNVVIEKLPDVPLKSEKEFEKIVTDVMQRKN